MTFYLTFVLFKALLSVSASKGKYRLMKHYISMLEYGKIFKM